VINNNDIDYDKHDVSISQKYIFELLRTMPQPNGKEIVNTLLEQRYNWFSVLPIYQQPFVPCHQVSQGSYYADGVNIYTDVGGDKILVPLLKKKLPYAQVDFMTMKPICDVVEGEELPDETTAFISVTWETPEKLDEQFIASVK
jgi:hypothetical protein